MLEKEDNKIKIYQKNQKEYPQRLRILGDMPDKLYVTGQMPKDDIPSLAIVGARNCSCAGEERLCPDRKSVV